MPETSAIPASANSANDLVTFRITTGDDNQEVSGTINIHSIVVSKEVNKVPSATIRILDGDPSSADFKISDTEQFVPGQTIQIALGYLSNDTVLFKGIIINHSNRINNDCAETIIECKHEIVRTTISPQNRHFNNMKDSDIAGQIIGGYGIENNIADTPIENKDLVQYNTTDWDFIVSRMDRIGFITFFDANQMLNIVQPDLSIPATPLDISYGDNILEFHAELDARSQISNVSVSSWNFQTQQVETTDADYTATSEGGNISSDDLSSALNVGQLDIRSTAQLSEEERRAIANARKMKNILSKINGTVKFGGQGSLNAGDVFTLKGVGDRFNGPVFVSAVKHEYADGDWTTEATLGMPSGWYSERVSSGAQNGSAIGNRGNIAASTGSANHATGLLSTMQGLQIGVVNSLDDPENEFRVQVKLPSVNADEQGIWARVATLDAGNNRGTFFRPEVGDEVITGFLNNDPSQAIILGMLHSPALPSPISQTTDNNEKGLQTREGIKLTFDDGNKAVKLETPSGKRLTLSDNDGIVKVEDDYDNAITFDNNGISMESAKDITIKAQGNISLQGNEISLKGNASASIDAVSVSVSGSGTTEIKGAMVKIN